ncbi:MAG: hypothetical protein HY420_04805 [Candidatus Kerfeldbacteria bacterium]|nr:hypothetical protein [Candidatus Kerfeldbacteria bacterium]
MNIKTNLLTGELTTTRIGLIFLFTAVVALGVAIIASGAVALSNFQQRRAQLEAAQRNVFRISALHQAVSNEKANPGVIAFYIDRKFAGAINEEGAYSPAADPPTGGPLAILFLNPANTALPTTVEFSPQTFTLTTNAERLVVCVPRITGGNEIWVAKTGSTYFDETLTKLARSC